MKKYSVFFILALFICFLTGCMNLGESENSNNNSNNESAAAQIILKSVNGGGFYSGNGVAGDPFYVNSGFESDSGPIITLTYGNIGKGHAQVLNVVNVSNQNYKLRFTNCVSKELYANYSTSCIIQFQLVNNQLGYHNLILPSLVFTDSSLPYPQQIQFQWNNNTAVFVNVMQSGGNNVIGYILPTNNIEGVVGLTSFLTIHFRTNVGVASGLEIDLSNIAPLLNIREHIYKCPDIDSSGMVCQIPIQFTPTNAVFNVVSTLPFTYKNNYGVLQIGSLDVTINVYKDK